jgi:hypothetical protein
MMQRHGIAHDKSGRRWECAWIQPAHQISKVTYITLREEGSSGPYTHWTLVGYPPEAFGLPLIDGEFRAYPVRNEDPSLAV